MFTYMQPSACMCVCVAESVSMYVWLLQWVINGRLSQLLGSAETHGLLIYLLLKGKNKQI